MIITESRKEKDCPCGCGQIVPYLSGTIKQGNSAPFFWAYLLDDGDGPHLWLMLHSGPWDGFSKDCAVIIHAYPESGELKCFISDQADSPWKTLDVEQVHFLSRKEVLTLPNGKNWAFRVHDYFVDNQEEVNAFLQLGT